MHTIEKEELDPQLAEYYQQFARAYMAIGKFQKAREYIVQAEKTWEEYGGEEHENLEGIRQLWNVLEAAEKDAEEE